MFTSEVLNKAADLIEERGWGQGPTTWHDLNDGLCIEGGILAALGLDSYDHASSPEFLACPAYVAVRQYLGERCRNTVVDADHDKLWAWNDTVAQSATEVVEVLRAAAVIEAAREEQDAAWETYAPNVEVIPAHKVAS